MPDTRTVEGAMRFKELIKRFSWKSRIRAMAMEEAARICDRLAWSNANNQFFNNGPELNSARCATEIRAAISKDRQ